MRVVVLTDAECQAILDRLELAKFRARFSSAAPQLLDDVHRAFHYEVVRWLQKHGALLGQP